MLCFIGFFYDYCHLINYIILFTAALSFIILHIMLYLVYYCYYFFVYYIICYDFKQQKYETELKLKAQKRKNKGRKETLKNV